MPDLTVGYCYHDGVYEPQLYVYANPLPQGKMRSTATHLARFMIALLQGGDYAVLTVVVLAFTWWLRYWNLLGFQY